MLKSWRVWLGVTISLVALYFAFRNVDFVEVGAALRRANYLYLVPAMGIYFFGVYLRAVRWHYLLRPSRDIASGQLFEIVVIGYMANDVLPARMGELVRVQLLRRKYDLSRATSLVTIVIERVLDGLAMLSFIAVVGFYVPLGENLQRGLRLVSAIFLASILVLLVVASSKRLARQLGARFVALLPGRFHDRGHDAVERALVGVTALESGSTIAIVFGLSLLAWLAETVMYYVIGLGFGLALPFHVYMLTMAVANLGTMIPSSPGYVGTFHALGIFTLTAFGAQYDLAASYVVILHATLLIPVIALGLVYAWREHLSLRELPKASPEG